MASLPNNTFASPGNPYYAAIGGGGGDTLQSPVSLIPEAGGNQQLNIVASTGTGESSVLIASDVANANVSLTLSTVGQGSANILMGDVAAPGGTAGVAIVYPGAVVGGGQIQIENQSGGAPLAVFDTVGNQVFLGQTTSDGLTVIRNGLEVRDTFVTADQYGIGLTMTAPNVGVIAISGASGTLNLGSGTQNVSIIGLTDGGAPDTGRITIGGNGGGNAQILGGTVASPIPAIFSDAAGVENGALNIGSSAGVSNIIQLSDTGTTAGTGVANIAGSVFNSTGATIAGTAFTVGTTVLSPVVGTAIVQVPGQGGGGQNPVALTITPTLTTIGSPKVAARVPGTYNAGIDGLYTYNASINSVGSAAGVVGNLGAQIPPPSNGTPAAIGDQSLEGLYQVSLVTSNASTDIYSKLAQITIQSYWNPATGWFGGSGGASPFGGAEFRSGINPSNVIASGQLWVTNTSGNNWTGMSVRFVQLTGVIPNWFVA
jgi:hypothetical protein